MKKDYSGNLAFKIVILLTLFLIPNCEKIRSDQKKIEVGTAFYSEIGTKYQVNSNLSFTIDSINDQRCPRMEECFWAGFVALSFNIVQNNIPADTLIYFMMPLNNPFQIYNYKWEILEVDPWLDHTQLIDKRDYKIKMIIQSAN
jgi:hypothetical protein